MMSPQDQPLLVSLNSRSIFTRVYPDVATADRTMAHHRRRKDGSRGISLSSLSGATTLLEAPPSTLGDGAVSLAAPACGASRGEGWWEQIIH